MISMVRPAKQPSPGISRQEKSLPINGKNFRSTLRQEFQRRRDQDKPVEPELLQTPNHNQDTQAETLATVEAVNFPAKTQAEEAVNGELTMEPEALPLIEFTDEQAALLAANYLETPIPSDVSAQLPDELLRLAAAAPLFEASNPVTMSSSPPVTPEVSTGDKKPESALVMQVTAIDDQTEEKQPKMAVPVSQPETPEETGNSVNRPHRLSPAEAWQRPVTAAIPVSVTEVKELQEKPVNQAKQMAKELAEWESSKLGGTKAAASSSAAGDNQAARESRYDTPGFLQGNNSFSAKLADAANTGADKMPLPTDVDAEDVLNQVVRKAELMLKLNSSQMKIELHPEFLGKLTIKIMVEEGAVTARFITDNHQVKQMLETNLGMLRQSLEAQGMRVERAEINVQLNNGGLFDGSEGQRQWMWNQPQQQTRASDYMGEEDLESLSSADVAPIASVNNYYGISADGSMNFLV